ncbi:MAG: hypothetical protein IGQ88_09215 [Gloeomargaritaceae cyanobacterium C42_A2020_066]|nr:hypothetical protein [Gloeomargaritaceae cyanobacterium C42_A2020_066]
MIYLAEVQKKNKTGFLAGARTDLKLLACQRGETWSSLGGEEHLTVEENLVGGFNTGVLVLVHTGPNNQVQRVQEATRPLITALQQTTKLQERVREQEQQISQWQESLTYQAEEMARRQQEMDERQAYLQELEAGLADMANQRQQLDAAQADLADLKVKLEQEQAALARAQQELQGEQRRFSETRPPLSQPAEIQRAKQLLGTLESRLLGFTPQLAQLRNRLQQQQDLLRSHWQRIEEQRRLVEQYRSESEQQDRTLTEIRQAYQASIQSLAEAQALLAGRQRALEVDQEQATYLRDQLEVLSGLCQTLAQLVGPGLDCVDQAALQAMPLEALVEEANSLERQLRDLSEFVDAQEEELSLQQQAINELRQQIQKANEFDRLSLESELETEIQNYEFQEKSLLGQRQSLAQREAVLQAYRKILLRRQGHEATSAGVVELESVQANLVHLRQVTRQALQAKESALSHVQQELQQLQQEVGERQRQVQERWQQHVEMEKCCQEQCQALGTATGRLQLYEELLQGVQDRLDEALGDLDALEAQAAGRPDEPGAHAAVQELMGFILATTEGGDLEQAAS